MNFKSRNTNGNKYEIKTSNARPMLWNVFWAKLRKVIPSKKSNKKLTVGLPKTTLIKFVKLMYTSLVTYTMTKTLLMFLALVFQSLLF